MAPVSTAPVSGVRRRRARTPTVLQIEQVECGAACLGMVLAFHGRWVPLEELRVACGVSRDGTKASNVVRAARRYGLVAQGFSKELHELHSLPLPFVVFWNFNHFVVVEGIGPELVHLNDPATRPRATSMEEFDEAFTGVVLVFRPGPEFRIGGRRRSAARFVLDRLGGARNGVALALLAGLGLVMLGLVAPLLTQRFVDSFIATGSRRWIAPALLGLAGAAAGRAALTWLEGRCLLRIWERMSADSARQLLWHVLTLPMSFFVQRHAGEIAARLGVSDAVARLVALEIARGLLDAVVVVGFTVLMVAYDLVLTVVAVAVAALNVVALALLARRHEDRTRLLSLEQATLLGTSLGGLHMIETLKATGSEPDFFARWAGHQARVLRAQEEMEVSAHSLRIVPSLLATTASSLVLIVGGRRILAGDLSVGGLIAFQVLLVSLLQPFTRLVELAGGMLSVRADLERLDDIFNQPPDPHIGTVEGTPGPEPPSPGLELRAVAFGYNSLDEPLVRDLSLVVPGGGRVAIVGASGSGKSTVAKLVSGLYEPWSGDVLFGGRARHAYPREVIARSVRSVDQDILLFQGSIRDNLTLWDPHVTDEAIERAASDACILEEILCREGGFDGPVAEGGSNFSGGERQRLEIARALVSDPHLLVLDEATSSLDAVTEAAILENLRRRACSCVVVAHRLSTIREAEEIVVLDSGRVIERGNHEELMRRGEAYARLVRAE